MGTILFRATRPEPLEVVQDDSWDRFEELSSEIQQQAATDSQSAMDYLRAWVARVDREDARRDGLKRAWAAKIREYEDAQAAKHEAFRARIAGHGC